MARPEKQGLDYYPKDVDADLDDKLSMIIAEFGLKGEVLYDKLCCWIYKHEGYYMSLGEDVQLRFLRRYDYCGFSRSFINEVVPRLVKWGLFEKSVFNSLEILTSRRIQKTWIDASRKRTGRKIRSEIWLLEVNDGSKAEETEFPAEETPQKKEDKRKVENSKKVTSTRANALVAGEEEKSRELKRKYAELIKSCEGKDLSETVASIKAFLSDNKPTFIEPYCDYWNLFAERYSLAKVEIPTDKRKNKIRLRVHEQAFDFTKIIEKIKLSPTLRGERGDWKVTFDWIIENQTNYAKILDGNYQ